MNGMAPTRIPSKKELVDRIFLSVEKRRFSLEEALTNVLFEYGLDRIDSEYEARRLVSQCWSVVRERIKEEESKGLYPTMEIIDEMRFELGTFTERVEGASNKEKIVKIRLKQRAHISDLIDKMSAQQYEIFGAALCYLSGAGEDFAKRTRLSGDENIDFVALMPLNGRTHLFPSGKNRVRLIGQCKKWGSKTQKKDINLMAETITKVVNLNPDLSEVLPSWFVSSEGPILGCFVSHRGYQSGAKIEAQRHGFVLADSRDLTEIVCLSKKWDIGEGADGAERLLHKCLEMFK